MSTLRSLHVPFLDLGRIHAELADELLDRFAGLIDDGSFVNGGPVAAFEQAFASYCGSAHSVGVASGLDALRLILLAAEIEPGSEVIVPANSFAASAEAVVQAGAVPRFVDVSPVDFNLDEQSTRAALTDRTAALMPVDLYGQLVDGAWIRELAAEHDLFVVEDACQAHGATRAGHRSGSVGDAAAFSFYPGKNLGAMGDAGAVVCRDPGLAERLRALREHGQLRKYEHRFVGYTARLDTIQAHVLLAKLPHLDRWNAERRAVAAAYSEGLAGIDGLELPAVPAGSEPVWHLYVVRVDDPPGFAAHLAARGIQTGRHYPEPLHLAEAFAGLGYARGDFPVSERLAETVVSLPVFPGLTEAEVEAVVGAVREYFGS